MNYLLTILISFIIIYAIYKLYIFASISERIKKLKEEFEDFSICAESINQQIELADELKSSFEIPPKYEIGPDKLPRRKNAKKDWGEDFTVYLTPTGYKYHIKPHCSKNSYPANIANAKNRYGHCLICCRDYHMPDLEWYESYLQYSKELSKLKSLQSDLGKIKNKILTQRETLNNSFFTKMLEWSPAKRIELYTLDRVLETDIETLSTVNIDIAMDDASHQQASNAETINPKSTKKEFAIPDSVAIDKNGLPYVKMREYGYGKRFNAFITKHSDCYHRSKCPSIRFHKKTVIHRYDAMKKYKPCSHCNPINYIDGWYKLYLDSKKDETIRNN